MCYSAWCAYPFVHADEQGPGTPRSTTVRRSGLINGPHHHHRSRTMPPSRTSPPAQTNTLCRQRFWNRPAQLVARRLSSVRLHLRTPRPLLHIGPRSLQVLGWVRGPVRVGEAPNKAIPIMTKPAIPQLPPQVGALAPHHKPPFPRKVPLLTDRLLLVLRWGKSRSHAIGHTLLRPALQEYEVTPHILHFFDSAPSCSSTCTLLYLQSRWRAMRGTHCFRSLHLQPPFLVLQ